MHQPIVDSRYPFADTKITQDDVYDPYTLFSNKLVRESPNRSNSYEEN